MPTTRTTLAAIALLVVALLVPSVRADLSAERLTRLDAFLDAYVADGKLPGAVLQVTHDGNTVYHRAAGFRDREAAIPMEPNTIFRIASMSKAVVSAAVMMLQERGALLGFGAGEHRVQGGCAMRLSRQWTFSSVGGRLTE